MKQERLLSLDVMRTASILLVLCRHTVDPPASATLANLLHCGGWIGVDLFFVLSGFLVSGLLFQEHQRRGSLRWGRFLVRRGFKIYPAFYAMMAVAIAVAIRRHDLQWKPALAELLFVQNYVHGMWLHTWSLAVEEPF
jgi:peptidoglycan/LPS O-acetylase OafA/YrhL